MENKCETCNRSMRCIIGDFWLCSVCDKDANPDEWDMAAEDDTPSILDPVFEIIVNGKVVV